MIENVAATLVSQDFGTWSRADIERIVAGAGWSIGDEEEYSVPIETGGVGHARSMKRHYGQDGFGYGEHTDLQIEESCPADQLEARYAATLAAVISVLGPPALVGGPDAWTFWRNPRVRLARDIRRTAVTLRVEPAEPAEAEEYSNANWSEGWEPEHLWNAEPDLTSDAEESLIGMLFHDAGPAQTWDQFERSLRELFASFAADIPTLAAYAPHVGWQITPVSGGRFVNGRFTPDGVELGSDDPGIETELPPGPDSGRRIAEIALTAMRGWGLASPAELRYRCRVPRPGRLSAQSGFRIPL